MFEGNRVKGISLWANYKIGFEVTQSYLKNHPEKTIEEWTNINSTKILEGSNNNYLNSS
ncbi:DUF2268 domain-containing putative Zn-dependent protease [Bacillus sp. 2205SS5-2]|uniref:DUF2268 domain-containing putative Zn-dependent protease n=1 Tax=Bacillus sp. 2205SS5-2 TaxID=3109031 RepID=UPI003FA56573